MDKMLVAVFDDEGKAYEGSRILRELDAEGSIELFAMSVIAKDASGKVDVKEAADERPLGTAVGLLTGGVVVRRARKDVVDVLLQRDAAVLEAELEQLKAERARAAKEHKAELDATVEAVEAKVRATQDRAKAALAAAKEENEAKINVLRARIGKASGEAKGKMEARIAERRAEHERRSKLLREAMELTEQALAE